MSFEAYEVEAAVEVTQAGAYPLPRHDLSSAYLVDMKNCELLGDRPGLLDGITWGE